MSDEKLICMRCDKEMVPEKTNFIYMKFAFNYDLPRCPQCGQVYIPEDLVAGKMASVELELEEK